MVRIAILSQNPYLFGMLGGVSKLSFRGIVLAPLLVLALLSCEVRGQGGGTDPFANYRARLQKGDTTAALGLVTALSHDDTTLDAQMANFVLAKRALDRADTHEAFTRFDDAIPEILWDHAAWLCALEYQNADQDSLASQFWSRIARDTSSVYAEDALYELARIASENQELNSLYHLYRTVNILRNRERHEDFRLLLAETLAELDHHNEAVEYLTDLAVNSAHTVAGQIARDELDSYYENYAHRPRTQTQKELEQELEVLSKNGKFEWGLGRVATEYVRPGWQAQNDLLLFYKGRYESGLGRHSAAILDLKNHRAAYPQSPFAHRALYYLGRSAYLYDQDTLAITSLTRLVTNSSDTELVNQGLELLGLLYMDRHRPRDAAVVLRRWEELSKDQSSHSDALWRLGWALWEIEDYRGARLAWTELSLITSDSEYVPASLYWSARAADQMGAVNEAKLSYRALDSTFTHSYYSVIRRRASVSDSVFELPLVPPSLDDLCLSPGLHSRKFGLLAAMQLPDLALKEWAAAQREQPVSPGFTWWMAQVQFWDGDRLEAWRTTRTKLGAYIRTGGQRPDDFYRIAYPLDHDSAVVELSREYRLDPHFVFGVICQESHFEQEIVSPAGAIGLMQLMPNAASIQARKLGLDFSTPRLYSPDFNLRIGIAHLAELMSEFNGDTVLALASYNAGKNAALEWQTEYGNRSRDVFIERIPYRETRLFVKRVFEHTAAYRRLYPNVANRS